MLLLLLILTWFLPGFSALRFMQKTVEQDALMSPNPKGKLEDHAAGCVCVVYLFETC